MRIYRSEVTPPAALTAPPVLQRWSAWEDLRGAGRNRRIPPGPGLYRIRRAGGEPGLDYIGQTGRSLRGRLGQLNGVYHAQMPYRDPHTAAPALWALRHRDGCDFEVAVIEVPGTAPQRKALEATAITLYRIGLRAVPGSQLRPHARRLPDLERQQRPAGRGRAALPRRPGPGGPGRSRQRAGQRAAGRGSSLRGLDELGMEPVGADLPGPPVSGRHRAVPRPLQLPCRARLRRPGNHRATAPGARGESPQQPATARAPASPATWRHPGSHCPASRSSACSSTKTISSPLTSSPQDTHRQRNSSDSPDPAGNARRRNRGQRACTAHTTQI